MTERLLRAIGRAELIDDPRFRTNDDRLRHADELEAVIGAFVGERTQAENVAFFEAAEVTIGPIYDISQIVDDPHIRARGLIEDYPDADMGSYPMHAVVPRMSGTPGSIRSPAPRLGQDAREVLAGLGIAGSEIESLIASGVVCVDAEAVPEQAE
jgi:formyl-CoA transferase